VIGADRHERTEQRLGYRNGYRSRSLTTQVGDIDLLIPKLRAGSFLPSILEPRRRVDQALYAVIMEAYINGVSTRKVDALVSALGSQSGISKSQVSRRGPQVIPGHHPRNYLGCPICQEIDQQVQAFLNRPLQETGYAYVYLDATYLHGRLGKALQVCSRAVVVAMGVNADGRRELLGLKVGDSESEGFWTEFIASLIAAGCDDPGNPRSSGLTLRRPTRLPVVVFQKICRPGLMGPISKEASDLIRAWSRGPITVLSGFPADRSFPTTIKKRWHHQPWHRSARAEHLTS
jgi:hypothetical protein